MLKLRLLSLLIGYSKVTFEQVTVTKLSAGLRQNCSIIILSYISGKLLSTLELDNLPFAFNTFGVVLLLEVVFVISGISKKP